MSYNSLSYLYKNPFEKVKQFTNVAKKSCISFIMEYILDAIHFVTDLSVCGSYFHIQSKINLSYDLAIHQSDSVKIQAAHKERYTISQTIACSCPQPPLVRDNRETIIDGWFETDSETLWESYLSKYICETATWYNRLKLLREHRM